MNKIICIKPIINKKNNQVNLNFPKKQMPKKLKDLLKTNVGLKKMKITLEGWE